MAAIITLEQREDTCQTVPCGWILYTAKERVRNHFYITCYEKACKKYGIAVAVGIYEQPSGWDLQAKAVLARLVLQEKPAFVINRTRDYRLARALEEIGVQVYNSSIVAELGNDKAKAYHYMEKHGIPMLPVCDAANTPKWFPAVIKSCSGHGGAEVFYIKDHVQWQEWKRLHAGDRQPYLAQQAASQLGCDLRVYIVGNEITAAVLRKSATDFRSNYCLGGDIALYHLTTEQRMLAERVIEPLTIGMAGIDFVFHHGQMMFNELEDMAGARALYALSDYDIARDYIRYIKETCLACQ